MGDNNINSHIVLQDSKYKNKDLYDNLKMKAISKVNKILKKSFWLLNF